jgi:hypothetical protein
VIPAERFGLIITLERRHGRGALAVSKLTHSKLLPYRQEKNSGVELGEQPTPKRASYKYGGGRAREKYMSAQDIF